MIKGLKRLVSMVFRRDAYRWFWQPNSSVDYLSKVGDGTGSSLVAAVVNWVARTFPEAPPMLWRELANGQEEQARTHPLLKLLRKPNGFYTGVILWMATVTDWMVDGNAYWWKRRDRNGTVRELWWIPHWMIEPKGDETSFISHYEYNVDGQLFSIPVDDIVHFRFGLDSDNPRLGKSQLKSVLREVFTDNEAAAFTASLLSNMGVPGLVISPDGGVAQNEDVERTKAYVDAQFTGDGRGRSLVMKGPTKIQSFGFSPEELVLTQLRRVPEERVSAVTGIPAIVVGFGAGLERSTFTNMGEAREAAYEAGLIPTQRIMAEEVLFQLLAEFEDDVFGWRFGFDLSKVRVLQEDLYRQAQRNDLAIRGGWMMVGEGRRAMGLEVDEERDSIFLRPMNFAQVGADDGRVTPLAGGASAREQSLKEALDRSLSAQRYALAAKGGIVSEEEARDDLGFTGPPPPAPASGNANGNGGGEDAAAVVNDLVKA